MAVALLHRELDTFVEVLERLNEIPEEMEGAKKILSEFAA